MAIILILSQSCSTTRGLEDDKRALVKNSFKIVTDDDRVRKADLKLELQPLVKQKPQKKNPLNPRSWGKPLTIFDELLTEETVEDIQKYLRNRKGFYNSIVTYKVEHKGRRTAVAYLIELKKRSYVGNVNYESDDSLIYDLIVPIPEERIVDTGAPLDAKIFERERVRIVNTLTENGYANFNGNYIEFQGDSSGHEAVDITFKIYAPLRQENHPRYKIGDINIFTEHVLSQNPKIGITDTLNGYNFVAKTDKFVVQPDVISNIISLRSGELFSKTQEAKTNRNLARLSPYRFALLDPYISSDSIYNYNIFLTPKESKWVFDMGANLFYSSISQIGRNLFGFSGNVGFQNRNFRNRAIRHSIGLEGTFEFEFKGPTNIEANSISTQLNNTFDIPRVVDIFKITNVLNKFGLIADQSYATLDQHGTTEMKFGIGLTSILDFYVLNSVNGSWSYDFQPTQRRRYIIRQIGINVLDFDIKERFQTEILDNNRLLAESFKDNLFTGFIFRELTLFRQSEEGRRGFSSSFIGNFELSGLENLLVNKFVNAVSSYDNAWTLGNLQFNEFFRLSGDYRLYKKFGPKFSWASRFNAAIAVPYGNSEEVNFIKQYFVGGPNSIRGWQLRELGPGGHSQALLFPENDRAFFQSGNLKLEFNTELRFDVFWLLEGALFLDGGNVWLLKEDTERENSQFGSNFLNQMALSAGYGFRLDFDYFIFRFDIGYKLRNPFPDPETGKHFVLTNGKYNGVLGNVNFAINYPF